MARITTGIDVGRRTSKLVRGHYKGNTFHVTDFAVAESAGGVCASTRPRTSSEQSLPT